MQISIDPSNVSPVSVITAARAAVNDHISSLVQQREVLLFDLNEIDKKLAACNDKSGELTTFIDANAAQVIGQQP